MKWVIPLCLALLPDGKGSLCLKGATLITPAGAYHLKVCASCRDRCVKAGISVYDRPRDVYVGLAKGMKFEKLARHMKLKLPCCSRPPSRPSSCRTHRA